MDIKSIQSFLAQQKLYAGEIDGDAGPATRKAIDALLEREKIPTRGWTVARREVAVKQIMCRVGGIDAGEIDGLVGPQTLYAFAAHDIPNTTNRMGIEAANYEGGPHPTPKVIANEWPQQRQVPTFYGSVGKNQTQITLPVPMLLAWDLKKTVKTITLHQKVADSALRVFQRMHDAYTPEQIADLGLNLFGGSLNVRKMRGGSEWSMHSWGIAIDFDPIRNQLHMGRDKARLGKPDAERFWKLWEEEGWASLGRVKNYDWMHVQAARL